MGSVLSQPSILDIAVDVTDIDADDKISKIEVITSGGTVAASEIFSSNTVNWSTQLPAADKYYYIKVTEADEQYAFSAPIYINASVTAANECCPCGEHNISDRLEQRIDIR